MIYDNAIRQGPAFPCRPQLASDGASAQRIRPRRISSLNLSISLV